MKGFSIGFVYTVAGIGGLLSSLLSIIIGAADSRFYYQFNTLEFGDVQYFYVTLIVLVAVGLLLFVVTAWRFEQRR